jgi:hypothetical protein
MGSRILVTKTNGETYWFDAPSEQSEFMIAVSNFSVMLNEGMIISYTINPANEMESR